MDTQKERPFEVRLEHDFSRGDVYNLWIMRYPRGGDFMEVLHYDPKHGNFEWVKTEQGTFQEPTFIFTRVMVRQGILQLLVDEIYRVDRTLPSGAQLQEGEKGAMIHHLNDLRNLVFNSSRIKVERELVEELPPMEEEVDADL